MTYHFIAEELCILLLQAKAIILLVTIPLFQLDDQVNGLRILDTLHTEQCLDINDSDTAQLDKMTRDIR